MPTPPDWITAGWPHSWLPYTQMQTAQPPLPVVDAEACELVLADGTRLIDGIASWWSICHGYKHPEMVAAIQQQVAQLSHVMFGGLAHEPAMRLAARLAHIAPSGLSRVFFSDSGSTAVEVALKMALQYWRNKGEHRRTKFICFRNAYHGDTFGAMAVSERGSWHQAFDGMLPKHYVLDIPDDEYSFREFEEMADGIAGNCAGLIIEPLVQAAGGFKFHSADILNEIRRVCRERGILFIADEVATGFGRTGNLFACNEAGITPDILCLGKALTSGMLPMAVTMASEDVYDAFLSDDPAHALMHGPTFMANAAACAAANASLNLFGGEPRVTQAETIETQLLAELSPLRRLSQVLDVRVKGAIGVVQLREEITDRAALRQRFVEHGAWIRPFGDVVYLMPPLVIGDTQLSKLTGAMAKVLGE